MFAQASIKVDEVAQELAEMRAAIGSSFDVKRFTHDAFRANRAVVAGDEAVRVELAEAPQALRDAMGLFDGDGFRGRFALPVAEGKCTCRGPTRTWRGWPRTPPTPLWMV